MTVLQAPRKKSFFSRARVGLKITNTRRSRVLSGFQHHEGKGKMRLLELGACKMFLLPRRENNESFWPRIRLEFIFWFRNLKNWQTKRFQSSLILYGRVSWRFLQFQEFLGLLEWTLPAWAPLIRPGIIGTICWTGGWQINCKTFFPYFLAALLGTNSITSRCLISSWEVVRPGGWEVAQVAEIFLFELHQQ